MRTRVLLLAVALAAAPTIGCKRDEPPGVAVAAELRVAPVVADHPWVIAFLTEVSITRPPGADARLEGRTEPDGRYLPEPVFEAETREALAGFLRDYEKNHPRPPELTPVWEPIAAGPGGLSSWRLHFVDERAGFRLDGEASARLDSSAAGSVVRLRLGPAQREQFAALTRAHLGQRVAIMIGDEVINLPVVRSEISGGELQLLPSPGVEPGAAAPALLERLQEAQ